MPISPLQSLNNIKMSIKLIGGFGFVVLLFIIVMMIYQNTVSMTSGSFNDLIKFDVNIARHASKVQILMLECRKNEKNFLSLKDKKYVTRMAENAEKMITVVQSIIDIYRKAGKDESVKNAMAIIDNIKTYQEYFDEVVQEYEKMGLNDNSGIIGDFNRTIEEFIKRMEQHRTEDLYLETLRLIRYQSEYFNTKSVGKKRMLVETLKKVKEGGENMKAHLTLVVVKDAIKDMVPKYASAFKQYLKAEGTGKEFVHAQKMIDITTEMEDMIKNTYIQSVQSYVLKIRENEKNYLLHKDQKYVQATHEAMNNLLKAIKNSGSPVMFIEEADQSLTDYRTAFDALVAEDEKIKQLMIPMNNAVNKITFLVENLYKKAEDAADKRENIVNNKVGVRSRIAIVIGLSAIILGVLLSILITRGITQPVIKTVNFANNLSKGDLSQKLNIHQEDEIGFLAKALNEMVANISSIFEKIIVGIDLLSGSSSELTEISQTMANGSKETSEKSDTVAKAAEKMTSNFSKVSANMDQASINVDMVASASEEMTSSINNISLNSESARNICQQAVAQAQQSSEKMNELNTSALDIGKIVEAIEEISDQTNLLALNATIEAARAGDSGKGFAVVAGEIKELAAKTAESTKEIKSRIENIQTITDHTRTEIFQISEVIQNVNEIVTTTALSIEEQSTTTQEIANNVVNASQVLQEINQNMAQSSSMAGDISNDIADVNHTAGGLLYSSSQVYDSAQELLKLAENLKETVSLVMLQHT